MSENSMPIYYADKCTSCGLCVTVCPEDVLALERGLLVFANPAACTYCGACEWCCPTQAVELYFEIAPARRVDKSETNDTGVSS